MMLIHHPLHPAEVKVLAEGKRFPQYSSSSALIKIPGEKMNMVFDAGSPHDRLAIERQVQENRLNPGDISYLLISHWHMDHLGALDLFKNAQLIISPETLSMQQKLIKAVLIAEKSNFPVETLTEILMDHGLHTRDESPGEADLPDPSKFRAMANITLRYAYLLKEFIRRYESGRAMVITEREIVLFDTVHIMKLPFHTGGDLIGRVTDATNGRIWLMGDVIVHRNCAAESWNWKTRSGEESFQHLIQPGSYILPGHDELFLVE